MAFINDTILMANKALNKIEALAGQAKSYYSNPAMLKARSTASRMANSAWTKGKSIMGNPAVYGGAIGGAAAGVGYSYATDNQGSMGDRLTAGLKGGLLGGALGAGYMGIKRAGGPMNAMKAMRNRASNYGSRVRTGWGNMVANAQASSKPAVSRRINML